VGSIRTSSSSVTGPANIELSSTPLAPSITVERVFGNSVVERASGTRAGRITVRIGKKRRVDFGHSGVGASSGQVLVGARVHAFLALSSAASESKPRFRIQAVTLA